MLPDCQTLILLDVEMTAWDGSNSRNWSLPWEEREIIQIAMLALEADTLKPINHFSCLVKPTINPELSDYISKLTGITQSAIDHEGLNLKNALGASEEFMDGFGQNAQVVSNGPDGQIICQNALLVNLAFPKAFQNCQSIGPYLRKYISIFRRGHCTGDLPDLIGRPLEGHRHNALYDVHALAIALRYIREKKNPG
jgi:inhibitor of KinA sporulation pathway (predicted exonuclease)